jgi:hypothetical protein
MYLTPGVSELSVGDSIELEAVLCWTAGGVSRDCRPVPATVVVTFVVVDPAVATPAEQSVGVGETNEYGQPARAHCTVTATAPGFTSAWAVCEGVVSAPVAIHVLGAGGAASSG